ncbi:hypothetical protein IWQ60_005027 [Tieghemiomyces parasiticus]|uniref:Conserved oligomeric Golgi complex subunit 7 n=1 Tax=Tieghemiomyces parasiticus TaxID=78921 RepID=A0A9W8ACJ6_9FUNG|nr:hypothetical protein IWQ60_005027 [Tieghemiomyces parasiticus]
MSIDLTAFSSVDFDLSDWLDANLSDGTSSSTTAAGQPGGLTSVQTQLQFLIQEVQYKHDTTVRKLTQAMPVIDKELTTLGTQMDHVQAFLRLYRSDVLVALGPATLDRKAVEATDADEAQQESSPTPPTATTTAMAAVNKEGSADPPVDGSVAAADALRRLVDLLTRWSDLEVKRSTLRSYQQWRTFESQVRMWIAEPDYSAAAKRIESARHSIHREDCELRDHPGRPAGSDPDGSLLDEEDTADSDGDSERVTSRTEAQLEYHQRKTDMRRRFALTQRLAEDLLEAMRPDVDSCLRTGCAAAARAALDAPYDPPTVPSDADAFRTWYHMYRRVGQSDRFWTHYIQFVVEPFIAAWQGLSTAGSDPTAGMNYFAALGAFLTTELERLGRALPVAVIRRPLRRIMYELGQVISPVLTAHCQRVARELEPPSDSTVEHHLAAYINTAELYDAVARFCTEMHIQLVHPGSSLSPGAVETPVTVPDESSDSDSDHEGSHAPSTGQPGEGDGATDGPEDDAEWIALLLEPFRPLQGQFATYECRILTAELDRRYKIHLDALERIEAIRTPNTTGTDVLDRATFEDTQSLLDRIARELHDSPAELLMGALSRLVHFTRGYGLPDLRGTLRTCYAERQTDHLLTILTRVARLAVLPDIGRLLVGPAWARKARPLETTETSSLNLPNLHTPSLQQIRLGCAAARVFYALVQQLYGVEALLQTYLSETLADLSFAAVTGEVPSKLNPDYYARPLVTTDLTTITTALGTQLRREAVPPTLTADYQPFRSDSDGQPNPLIRLHWTVTTFWWAASLGPIAGALAQFPRLPEWRRDDEATTADGRAVSTMNVLIPNFSRSPSSAVVQVGEYLLTLAQVWDTYLSDPATVEAFARVADPWLSAADHSADPDGVVTDMDDRPAVSSGGPLLAKLPAADRSADAFKEDLLARTLISLTQGILAVFGHLILVRLPAPLGRSGGGQLLTDVNYLSNIVRAMGIDELPAFRTLKDALTASLGEEGDDGKEPVVDSGLAADWKRWLAEFSPEELPALGLYLLRFLLARAPSQIVARSLELVRDGAC